MPPQSWRLLAAALTVFIIAGCTPALRMLPVALAPSADRGEASHDSPAAVAPCGSGGETMAPRVRSLDASIIALLADGCRWSPTLQQLVDDIAATNGIAYVERGRCTFPGLRGCLLHSIISTRTARYLWIRISISGDDADVLATIAHELQHALEVFSEPWVRSRHDMLHFYRSYEAGAFGSGLPGPIDSFETPAAIRAASKVRSELRTALEAVTDDRDRH